MKIIAIRVSPIINITKDIIGRRKSQKEVIEEIEALSKRYPRNSLFKGLRREYGEREVRDFEEVLKKVKKQYERNLFMKSIYSQIKENTPLGIYQRNQLGNNSPIFSIYAEKKNS